MPIVTIDFHNTLVLCDRWFELEVRTLPWEVLVALQPQRPVPSQDEILAAYRELRASVIASGVEIDSYASVERILDASGVSWRREPVRQAVDQLMDGALASATLVPGARELVAMLHQRGHRLAVVSSAVHHEFLEAALRRFGLAGHFERVVTSASSGHYKSNPEIYRSTVDRFGDDPARCVHVGDSLRWDVGSAQRIGMRTVWLDRDGAVRPWDDEPLPVPDLTVRSLVGASERILDFIDSVASANGTAP